MMKSVDHKFDEKVIREVYGRLIGIEEYLNKEHPHNPRKEVGDSYENLIIKLEKVTSEDLLEFKIPQNAYYSDDNRYCYLDLFLPKVIEFKRFIESKYEFLSHKDLPLEVRLYLSIRSNIIDFVKKRLTK